MRRWTMAVLAGLVAIPVQAATFTLCSQNTLHLGYSSSNQNKINQLRAEFATCDVTLLQEVMRRALDPPPLPAPPPVHAQPLPNGALRAVTPAPGNGYTWNVPFTAILGKTSYKESYSFIVKSTFNIATAGGLFVFYSPSPALANRFSRPPHAILIQAGATWIWLADYHAIFGKRQADRESEVREMANVATEIANTAVGGATYDTIIIAGDWNLDANNSAYNALKGNGYTVEPNVQTSLTTAGAPSEPYDHFAWSNSVTVTNAVRITPVSMPTWRATVSDHMAIQCTVTY